MQKQYPIKSLNTWRLGTAVRYYSQPKSLLELVDAYQQLAHMPTIWLGLGSNILFPDHELNAHIIKTHKALNQISHDQTVYAEAGVPLAKIARYCVKLGYEDAAFLVGIPGSLGGALMMNAEAYGYCIWAFVKSVSVLTKSGVETKYPKDFLIGYRQVQVPKDFVAFLSAELVFPKGSVEAGQQKMRQSLQKRNKAQPIGTFNCGSVFRNPLGRSAGLLMDGLGLKGYTIGEARISPKHANFIENMGDASSRDVGKLIQLMREAVWNTYKIRLNLEVKVYEY